MVRSVSEELWIFHLAFRVEKSNERSLVGDERRCHFKRPQHLRCQLDLLMAFSGGRTCLHTIHHMPEINRLQVPPNFLISNVLQPLRQCQAKFVDMANERAAQSLSDPLLLHQLFQLRDDSCKSALKAN